MLKKDRSSLVQSAASTEFDVLIVGGGIHGAWLALLATKAGYRVLLLDRNDFASGTSSASSNIAHAGVRYLLNGAIKLVVGGLKERAFLYKTAPHLVQQCPFAFAVQKGQDSYVFARIGLFFYSLLSRLPSGEKGLPRFAWSRKIRVSDLIYKGLSSAGLEFQQLILYWDGQYLGSRVAIELIQEARRLGATTINHANVSNLLQDSNGKWEVTWSADGKTLNSCASYVANLTGPWAEPVMKQLGHLSSNNKYELYRSRGVHLIFKVLWGGPAVICPTGVKGRYFFVLPYFSPGGRSLTLVGTTDDHTEEAPEFPEARPSEIAEIFEYLQRNFPEVDFSEDTLVGNYCGIRPLAKEVEANVPRVKKIARIIWFYTLALFWKVLGKSYERKMTATQVSRVERFIFRASAGTMLGGKYTNARESALIMLKNIRQTILPSGREDFSEIFLPGAAGIPLKPELRDAALINIFVEGRELLVSKEELGLTREQIDKVLYACVSRFGATATKIFSNISRVPQYLHLGFFEAEVIHCVVEEQALNPEDVIRRLCLEFTPGFDREQVTAAILSIIEQGDT